MDDGFVSLSSTTKSNAYVEFSDIWPSEYPTGLFGRTKLLITSAGINSYGAGMVGPPQYKSVDKITKCYVYANRAACSKSSFNDREIQHNWSHEIGHTLGFNEANDGSITVMRQGRGRDFGWSEYWKPQAHDRNDLKRFNYKIWGYYP